MRELLHYFEAEQPKINAFLQSESDKLDPLVRPLVQHVLKAGGKRLRPLLTMLTARALGHAGEGVYAMGSALEFLHSATLLHDDILDNAELRRGMPAAHLVFGQTETILAGDALLALGNKLMADFGDPRLNSCISEAIMKTAIGEIAEIAHIRNPALTEDQYLEIIQGKTAFLIQAACRCGALLAKASPRLEQAAADFGLHLGMAFQLVDDTLDYSPSSALTGKPVGADLREGKLTLPLLTYLGQASVAEREAFAARLRTNDFDQDYLAGLAAAINARGCVQATLDKARVYLDIAAVELRLFPDTHERTLLGQALDYVLTRER